MSLTLEDIKINKEYAKLVTPLSKEEYSQIKSSISTNGLYLPIIINESNIILDGHHRFKACNELEITPKYKVKKFENILLEKKFVILVNLDRRQLTIPQKFLLGEELEPINYALNKKAKKEAGEKYGENHPKRLPHKSGNLSRHENETTARTAKEVGLKRTQYERLKKIKKNATPEIWQDVVDGKTSVAHAFTKLNTITRHNKMVELPKEKFNIILADPPWKYDVLLRGNPERHYDVMDVEDIGKLNIPAADDCILFLWVTNPKIPDALRLLELWGFEYKTNFVWVKDKIGTGYYGRGQHELLFIGKKGNPPTPKEEDRPPTVINADRTTHSKKPDVVYSMIEKMYANGKYLEMFARNKRKGWESYGNQL